MAERSLDFRVVRRGRKLAEFNKKADPDDHGALQDILRDWLDRQGWAPGLWGSFQAEVRYAGEARLRKRVWVVK